MAFTVEDGTGVEGANAYITIAWADAYHADRGNAAWSGADTVKQQAIVRATDYIETRWAGRFKGVQEHLDPLQPLQWPRLNVRDINGLPVLGIPVNLMRATAEYALRALTAQLLPDPDLAQGAIIAERKKIGPIETETRRAEVATPILQRYPTADRLLHPLLLSSSGHVYR